MILRSFPLVLSSVLGFVFPGMALTPDFLRQRLIPPYTGPQLGAGQGGSVAIAGNFAVVGSPRDDVGGDSAGVVKIYHTGTGQLLHTLLNPAPSRSEQFGGAVAISGSRVAIGCAGNFLPGQQESGSVYIYDLASTTPTVPAHIVDNPAPQAFDHFGNAVALSGNRLVVAAVDDHTDGAYGRAFLYDLASGTPTVPVLTVRPPSPESASFGAAVAIVGTRLAVSSTFRNPGGTVFVYDLQSATPGTPVFTLNNPIARQDLFGCSLAFAGSRIAVGTSSSDAGYPNAGSVYVFELGGPTPAIPIFTINNPTPDGNDAFGVSVTMSGDRLAVGASNDETGGSPGGGSVSIYNLAGGIPTVPILTLRSPSPAEEDKFGSAVNLDGTRLLVGAPEDQPARSGSAYLHDLAGPTPHVATATFRASSPAGGERFGSAIAISGSRVVIGAPLHDAQAYDAGRAYVYDLNSGAPATPLFILENPTPGTGGRFGHSVAISGNLVAVGAPMNAPGLSGVVYIYNLASFTPTTPAHTLMRPGAGAEDEFGYSLAMSGMTLVVGAWKWNPGTHAESGAAYIYNLASATPSIPVRVLENPTPGNDDHFGVSVAISDTRIVVGAHEDDSTAFDAGTVYVYDLAGADPGTSLTLNNPAPAHQDRFGVAVGISGTRIVVGAYQDDAGVMDGGTAYVYDLASSTPAIPVTLPNPAPSMNDLFGKAVSISGSRVLIGASREDAVKGDAGVVYLYDLAGAAPATPVATLSKPSAAAGDEFGFATVIEGTRVAIGTTGDDTPTAEKGGAYIFGPAPLAVWKLEQLGDENAPDLGDQDWDGSANLLEYATVTGPNASNPPLPAGIAIDAVSGDRLRLILQRDPQRRDVTIDVRAASNLDGPWTTIASSVFGEPYIGSAEIIGDNASSGVKTVEIRDVLRLADSVARFLRVQVRR